MDTLEYLRRGGRIGTAGAWIGTTLKIKPILTFEEEVTPVERVRTRARSIERLVGYAEQRHEDGADAWVVNHIQDPEAAESLIEACRPIFSCEPARDVGDGAGGRRPRRPGPARDRRDDPLRAGPGLDAPASGGGAGR